MNKHLLVYFCAFSLLALVLVFKDGSQSSVFSMNVELLTANEGGSNPCHSGGPGATQCSINAGTTIVGVGISAGCSVTCSSGYYACCGIHCTCISY